MDGLRTRFTSLEARSARRRSAFPASKSVWGVEDRLDRIDACLDRLEVRVARQQQSIERMESRLDRLEEQGARQQQV